MALAVHFAEMQTDPFCQSATLWPFDLTNADRLKIDSVPCVRNERIYLHSCSVTARYGAGVHILYNAKIVFLGHLPTLYNVFLTFNRYYITDDRPVHLKHQLLVPVTKTLHTE